MFGLLLLCCCSFSLLHFSSSLVHGNIQLDNGPAGGHRTDSPYLSDIDQGFQTDFVKGCWFSNSPCLMCYHVYSANDKLEKPTDSPDQGRSHVPDPMQEAGLGPIDSVEDHFLMDAGSYDEDSSAALQLQGRAMRSPRLCIPHQQSCLGYPLPCCDPCDTCYCRFFNAICYCRRVGHTCPTRRT